MWVSRFRILTLPAWCPGWQVGCKTLASFRLGTCYGSFLPTLRFGNDVFWAGVCWPQQDLGEGMGMAPSCLQQTAASA